MNLYCALPSAKFTKPSKSVLPILRLKVQATLMQLSSQHHNHHRLRNYLLGIIWTFSSVWSNNHSNYIRKHGVIAPAVDFTLTSIQLEKKELLLMLMLHYSLPQQLQKLGYQQLQNQSLWCCKFVPFLSTSTA
jgi:hypothetical protein